MKKARIAVLVSGGGTNLQAILDAERAGAIPSGEVVLVLSSKPGVFALERAAKAGVPSVVCSRKDSPSQEAFEDAILAALREAKADLVVLAGFLSILGPRVIAAYPDRDNHLIDAVRYAVEGAMQRREARAVDRARLGF